MFYGCSCRCVPKVVNTISWKVLDLFSPNFQHRCILKRGWTRQVLAQKVKVQGHRGGPLCCKMHFLPRDARSAKRGIAIVSRPSVRPSTCNVDVPWASATCRLRKIRNPFAEPQYSADRTFNVSFRTSLLVMSYKKYPINSSTISM